MYHQSNGKPSDWLPTPPASVALKHLSRFSNFRAPVGPHRHDEPGDLLDPVFFKDKGKRD